MRPRRLAFGLIAPAALLVLVAALATLQYKWVGQVSEAERAQLRESLDRRVQELADDFDRELSRAFRVFQLSGEPLDPAAPEPFARRYDEWLRAARFPGFLRTAWYARIENGAIELFRYVPERRAFEPAEWPASLAAVRLGLNRRLGTFEDQVAGAATLFVASSSPVLPDIPAIVVPVRHLPTSTKLPDLPGGRSGVMFSFHLDDDQIVLELDRAHVQDTVLPALAERHFPEDDRFRVTVVDARARPVFARGLDEGGAIDAAHADATAAIFTLRVEAVREAMSFRMVDTVTRGRGGAATVRDRVAATPSLRALDGKMSVVLEQRSGITAMAEKAAVPAGTGWRVFVQHSAGSLDAAVASVRRRNLWLSFGILAVLAASVGLIVINARRSERLAAQQMDFVATVSHELRTPLAVIRSAAQNLSAGVVHEPAQASRYGDLIESEGRRLTDMVEQVLEYAGLSGNRRPLRAGPVDCSDLLRDVVDSCRGLLDAEGMEAEIDVAPGVPAVLADEDALRRALHNLITNALKYAADGRWLLVSARRGAGRGDGDVLLSVSDRGRGIAADDLAHIFEPFYRGRYAIERQIHGNGLGLSLVKRIADAHGGRVSVRSSSEGTTFTLHLPAAPADSAVTTVAGTTADAGAHR